MSSKKYQKVESDEHDENIISDDENEQIEVLKPKKKKTIIINDDDNIPSVISYSKAKTLKPRKPMSDLQMAHVNDLVEKNKIKFAEYRKLKQDQATKKHADEIDMMVRHKLKKVIVADRVRKPNNNHPFKQISRQKEIVSDSETETETETEEEIIKPIKKIKNKSIKYQPIQKQRQPKEIIEQVNKTIERIKEIDKIPINPYIALIRKNR